ncbi:hypothetical protein Acr_16g0010270 [Actinidia rufa]|uniref:Uncharacterized protein n=1 Tax=Actinidia rufa TaxID=165716 RepID=A0A7J0G0G3_9ERIC|nr:hypothetical protein Acr_16g0010270 [Actinidia rufa]
MPVALCVGPEGGSWQTFGSKEVVRKAAMEMAMKRRNTGSRQTFGSKEVVRKVAMKRRNTFDGRVLHLLEEEMEVWEEMTTGMHNHFSSFTNNYNLSLMHKHIIHKQGLSSSTSFVSNL